MLSPYSEAQLLEGSVIFWWSRQILVHPSVQCTLYYYIELALTRKICGISSKKLQKLALFKQAQRRAVMDRRMHCIIPNESYNINHNITTRHCSFEYALHIHDVIYEGAF